MGYFDDSYYIASKLKQLTAENATDANGEPYNVYTLRAAIASAGLTPEEHYKAYGQGEKLNPNAYFNESEYLQAKLAQLESVGETAPGGQPYTLETLKAAIAGSGLTAAEHYEMYGSKETTADGHLLNPSNAFDANAYVAAKLAQLQSEGSPEAAQWEGKTVVELVAALQAAGISPVTHYIDYGAAEATSAKIPLVQTVPSEQRVANDPAREANHEVVPTNYNPATPAPGDAKPAPVTKPADVAQKVDASVSPAPIIPEKSAPVPGDDAYVAPPANIKDTVANPVIPPSSADAGTASGNWMVVNPDKGTGTIVGQDGTIKGEVKVEITPGTGGSTVVIPPAEDKPVDKLPPATELPPSVTPDPDKPGNVTPPVTPPSGGGDDGPTYTNDLHVRVKNGDFLKSDWSASDKDATSLDHDTIILDIGHSEGNTIKSITAAEFTATLQKIHNIEQVNLESINIDNAITVNVAAVKAANSQIKYLGFSDNQASKDDHYGKAATVFTNLSDDITVVHTKYDVMKDSDGDGNLYNSIKGSGAADLVAANQGFGYASVSLGAATGDGANGTVRLITERSVTKDDGTGIAAGANETVVMVNKVAAADTTHSSFTKLIAGGEGNLVMNNSGTDRDITIDASGLTGKLSYTGSAGHKSDITCGSGNDRVYGDGKSNDNFHSGSGTDVSGSTIIAGNGADSIYGTKSNDTIYLGASADSNADSGSGDDRLKAIVNDEGFKPFLGNVVNSVNGWLGNDDITASNQKDVFEYHTHVTTKGYTDGQAYAATSFAALGTDTIRGFDIKEDVLLINMIELEDGGTKPANHSGGTEGTGHGIKRGDAFADLLMQSDVKEANVTWGTDSIAASGGEVKVNVKAIDGGNEVKFYFGDTGDTLTLNLIGVTNNGVSVAAATNQDTAQDLVAGLLVGGTWLNA